MDPQLKTLDNAKQHFLYAKTLWKQMQTSNKLLNSIQAEMVSNFNETLQKFNKAAVFQNE